MEKKPPGGTVIIPPLALLSKLTVNPWKPNAQVVEDDERVEDDSGMTMKVVL
jgi:hypothetical protein